MGLSAIADAVLWYIFKYHLKFSVLALYRIISLCIVCAVVWAVIMDPAARPLQAIEFDEGVKLKYIHEGVIKVSYSAV